MAKQFNMDNVSDAFEGFLKAHGFTKMKNGKEVATALEAIDYRRYMYAPDADERFKQDVRAVLSNHGVSADNTNIFIAAIESISDEYDGFGKSFKDFFDKFGAPVPWVNIPNPPSPPESWEGDTRYAGIVMLDGFSPNKHIDDDGNFILDAPKEEDFREISPKGAPKLDAGGGVKAGLVAVGAGVGLVVSLPISSAVAVVLTVVVITALILEKPLKKAGIC